MGDVEKRLHRLEWAVEALVRQVVDLRRLIRQPYDRVPAFAGEGSDNDDQAEFAAIQAAWTEDGSGISG
jgi:hypothetical protein